VLKLLLAIFTLPIFAQVPASPNVFAGDGDLTYCQLSKASTTLVQAKLTCRRSGVTKFTANPITDNVKIVVGDITWILQFNGRTLSYQAFVADHTTVNVGWYNPSPVACPDHFILGEQLALSNGAVASVGAWSYQQRLGQADSGTMRLESLTTPLPSNVVSITGQSSNTTIYATEITPDSHLASQGTLTW
jgi:hypothetical protein